MAEVFDKSQKRNLLLVIVYGPAQEERREQFLTELSSICADIKIPTLIGGDFNIIRYSKEKNKNFNNNRFSELFNWVINSYELRDVTLSGGLYTWSNNQINPTLERLDRVLMSLEWEILFPLTNLRKKPRFLSDHNPLIICSDQDRRKKSKHFCFETS
jgi:endonuclease/exonuclease/phosphatase family metal-dependent hydrolase